MFNNYYIEMNGDKIILSNDKDKFICSSTLLKSKKDQKFNHVLSEALEIVSKYLNKYATKEELEAIVHPLPIEAELEYLHYEERDVFGPLLFINENYNKNTKIIQEILVVSKLLELPILTEKVASILAYYLFNVPKSI